MNPARIASLLRELADAIEAPEVKRKGSDLGWSAGSNGREFTLFAVCGCGVMHLNQVGEGIICPHCRMRGVSAGPDYSLGFFPLTYFTRPKVPV